jgi:hypothetical protein
VDEFVTFTGLAPSTSIVTMSLFVNGEPGPLSDRKAIPERPPGESVVKVASSLQRSEQTR